MKYNLIRFIRDLAFFALWVCVGTMAPGQSYQVQTYSEADGLPSATVYDVTQDRQGRMWFATRAGIAMYDGVTWEKYNIGWTAGITFFPYPGRSNRESLVIGLCISRWSCRGLS
jgi:ligand-binding sensor domain-containing protein